MKASTHGCVFLLGSAFAQGTFRPSLKDIALSSFPGVSLTPYSVATSLLPNEELSPLALEVKQDSADGPSKYVPKVSPCSASAPAIRQASSLSPEEQAWLPKRRNATVAPIYELIARLSIPGLDTDSYLDKIGNNSTLLPNIAIAFSGGGYRALLNGAGALAAFDNRTSDANRAGHLGGLLEASTYITGLSGGSWLVGSSALDSFRSVEDILDRSSDADAIWQFDMAITKGSKDGLLATTQYLESLVTDVEDKSSAGFKTSLTDVWGRALSYQLVTPVDGGPEVTFSSIQHDSSFVSGDMPMPIIVTDGRTPGTLVVDGNSTVHEINPWELGTFDPTVFAFAPLEYIGPNFSHGEIAWELECVTQFDNAGFIMGTSSTLFNQGLLQEQGQQGFVASVATKLLKDVGEEGGKYTACRARKISFVLTRLSADDVARYPNPFYGVNPQSNEIHDQSYLTLVDGGEDLQNLPLHPVTQPERNVDVIFAVDSSADTLAENGDLNWPNGTALIATYKRSLLDIANGTSFPSIPDANTFVNLGLNNRPTFFGCDAGNTTSATPLIVYIPNAPYAYLSNVSTFQMAYTTLERDNIIQNGYDVGMFSTFLVSASKLWQDMLTHVCSYNG